MDANKMARLTQGMKQIKASNKSNLNISRQDAEALNYQGIEAVNNGNFSGALNLFQQAAEAGNIDAMGNLAYLFENGEGVRQNFAEAFKWYKKAALGGNTDAMWSVATAYKEGIGTNQDDAQHFAWIKKLAESGDVQAMAVLGDAYFGGEGVMQNNDEAFKWYSRAANNGHINAMLSVAFFYAHGNVVEQNPILAMGWIERAANEANAQQEFDAISDIATTMRNLGDVFYDQNTYWENWARREGIILTDLGSDNPAKDLYKHYLVCYEKAARMGDSKATETLHRINSSFF